MDRQTQIELGKFQFVSSNISPGATNMVSNLAALINTLLGWVCIGVDVFIRTDFGERYLSLLRLLLGVMTFQTFKSLYWMIVNLFSFQFGEPLFWLQGLPDFRSIFSGGVDSFLYVVYTYGFLIASAIHLIAIRRREQEGREWHTMSFGTSMLTYLPWDAWHRLVEQTFTVIGHGWQRFLATLPESTVKAFVQGLSERIPFFLLKDMLIVNDWKLYRFIEPLLCCIVAVRVGEIEGLMGTWLLIASVALFIRNNMTYFELRGRALDLMDSQIESRYLEAAMRSEDKRKTAGFAVVPVPIQLGAEPFDIAATVQATLRQPVEPTN